MTMPATPMAATESAFASHGMPSQSEITTSVRPAMTTDDDQMSVEKCSASASSAWLSYFFATRLSMREREKSMPMARNITRKAQMETSTTTSSKNRRWMAS